MQAQGQAVRASLGNLGSAIAGSAPATLNDRLNRVSDRVESTISRIDMALNRIEGNPPSAEQANKAIQTTRPMANVVSELEQYAELLQRLAERLDTVA